MILSPSSGPSGGGSGSGIGAYTYIIAQNSAGTVYTAYDSTGAVVTSNSDPDIAPIMNTLLANLVTAGQGGKIFIKSGSYRCRGTWQTDPNDDTAKYLIGVPIVADADQFMPIVIEGECMGAHGEIYTRFSLGGAGPLNTVGVQIITDLASTALTDGYIHAIFKVLRQPAGQHFSNINFVQIGMGGIRWTCGTVGLTGAGSSWVNVDLSYASTVCITNGIILDVYSANTSYADSYVWASGVYNLSWGVKMPGGGNQGLCKIDSLHTANFVIGALLYDHSEVGYYLAQNCNNAIAVAQTTGHAVRINQFNPQQCAYYIYLQNQDCGCEISCLDAEPATGLTGNAGQNYVGLFGNGSYRFHGKISIHVKAWIDDKTDLNGAVRFASDFTLGGGYWPAAGSGYSLQYAGNPVQVLAGTTAGNANWSPIEMGSNYKKYVCNLTAWEDAGEVITFPVPFVATPVITQPVGFGATVSTTALTLPNTVGAAATGFISVEGA